MARALLCVLAALVLAHCALAQVVVPSINGFSPAGIISSDLSQTVTVIGTAMPWIDVATTTVTFTAVNSGQTEPCTPLSGTPAKIVCVLPPSMAGDEYSVTVEALASGPVRLTVLEAPQIDSLSPSTLPQSVDTLVTITLTSVSFLTYSTPSPVDFSVTVGSIPCTNAGWIAPNKIVCVANPGASSTTGSQALTVSVAFTAFPTFGATTTTNNVAVSGAETVVIAAGPQISALSPANAVTQEITALEFDITGFPVSLTPSVQPVDLSVTVGDVACSSVSFTLLAGGNGVAVSCVAHFPEADTGLKAIEATFSLYVPQGAGVPPVLVRYRVTSGAASSITVAQGPRISVVTPQSLTIGEANEVLLSITGLDVTTSRPPVSVAVSVGPFVCANAGHLTTDPSILKCTLTTPPYLNAPFTGLAVEATVTTVDALGDAHTFVLESESITLSLAKALPTTSVAAVYPSSVAKGEESVVAELSFTFALPTGAVFSITGIDISSQACTIPITAPSNTSVVSCSFTVEPTTPAGWHTVEAYYTLDGHSAVAYSHLLVTPSHLSDEVIPVVFSVWPRTTTPSTVQQPFQVFGQNLNTKGGAPQIFIGSTPCTGVTLIDVLDVSAINSTTFSAVPYAVPHGFEEQQRYSFGCTVQGVLGAGIQPVRLVYPDGTSALVNDLADLVYVVDERTPIIDEVSPAQIAADAPAGPVIITLHVSNIDVATLRPSAEGALSSTIPDVVFAAPTVMVGSVECADAFVVSSSSSVVCQLPSALPAGTYAVQVCFFGGVCSASATTVSFVSATSPVVTNVVPDVASSIRAIQVFTVSGARFVELVNPVDGIWQPLANPEEVRVYIGGQPCIVFAVSYVAVQCRMSPSQLAPGQATVEVQTQFGSSSAEFGVLAGSTVGVTGPQQPSVLSVTPAWSPLSGGSVITVHTDRAYHPELGIAPAVFIGTQPCANVEVVANDAVTCTVPPSAVQGTTTVSVSYLGQTSVANDGFLYWPVEPIHVPTILTSASSSFGVASVLVLAVVALLALLQ